MPTSLEFVTPASQAVQCSYHRVESSSQGTPFGLEDDKNDTPNRIQPIIGYEMNSEMLLCKFTNFFEHYGPPSGLIESDDLERCTKALLDANLLCQTDNGLQWQAYQQRPSAMHGNENKVFAPLKTIVDTILNYAGGRRGNDYDYRASPYRYLGTDMAGLNHKMDACIMETSPTAALSTDNAIIPQEFTKYRNVTNQIEVRHKIVGDCQHIMSEDPRRMFIYGITIEDNRVSVWYFSRSHSTKAISFDWLGDERGIHKFIRIFLSFALASPEDLGVDPRVCKARRENMDVFQQYIYMYPKPAEELESSAPKEAANCHQNSAEATTNTPENAPVTITGNVPTHRHSTRFAAKAAVAEAERLKAIKDEDDKRVATALEAARFRYFKTVDSIVPMHPYRISGRATRIWKVVEVKSVDDETPVTREILILKDVWLDKGRATEADNLDSIFRDIERVLEGAKARYAGDDWLDQFMSEDKRFASFDQPAKDRLRTLLTDQQYRSLFLTKVVAWKGKVSKDVSSDAAHSPKGIDVFTEPEITDDRRSICASTAMGSQSLARPRTNPPTPTTPKLKMNTRFGRRYAPKQQSRFIYQEVCTELNNVGTLGNCMDVVDQALTALQVLFCAGWVHRDISSGNVLALQVEGGRFKMKLSDLEFAEKLGFSDHRSDPRTGTPYFMPVEIMQRQYLLDGQRFPPRPNLSFATHLGLKEGTPKHNLYQKFYAFSVTIKSIPANATEDIPDAGSLPRYNYQHDLESLWWLVLYFISRGIDHYPSRKYAKRIFKRSLECSLARYSTLTNSVKKQLHPKLVTGFCDSMNSLRYELHQGYLFLEVFGLLKQDDAYSHIHGAFARSFRELLEKNEGAWKDLPLIDPCSSESITNGSPLAGFKHALDVSDSSNPDTHTNNSNKRAKIKE